MFSNRYRYRKNAEESLDRARHARKSEDTDAWLAIAEDWIPRSGIRSGRAAAEKIAGTITGGMGYR